MQDDMHVAPPTHPVSVMTVKTESERDRFHLTLLSIFYYIMGGLSVLGVCGGSVYLVLGVAAHRNPGAFSGQGPPPPLPMDWIFGGFGAFIVVASIGMAAVLLLAGRALSVRKWKILCYIAGGLVCLSVPFGTVLGVYTFLTMTRPGVQRMFEEARDASID